jgi:PAS domain S-box-containing protein
MDVFVEQADGTPRMSARAPLASALSLDDGAGVERVARTLQPVIGDVSASDPIGIPVRIPVVRNGSLLYVITVLVKPASFDVLIQAQDLPPGWTSGIVDARGNFVARIPFQPAGRPASTAYREASSQGKEGWYRGRTVENRDTFTAFRRSGLNDWTIGLAVPSEIILAATWKTAWLIGLAAFAATAMALVLAVVMGRRIVGPVVKLAHYARAVGGEQPIELPPADVDEIDGVATALKDADSAVRNSRKQIADELDAMRELHAFVTRLNDCRDVETALQEVLRAIMVIGNAEMGSVQVFDAQEECLEIVAQRGFGPEFLQRFAKVSHGDQSTSGRAMTLGATVAIEDVEADSRYESLRAIAAAAGYRAVQSTPMLSSSGELLGILSTHFRKPRVFSDHDLRVLDLYGRQAADVIERIRNEQAVRDGTAQRQLALDAARLGWWHFDPIRQVSWWDDRYREIFGVTEESGHADRILKWLHPDDAPSVLAAVAKSLDPADPQPYAAQYRVLRPDGATRWVEAHGIATFEGSGESRRATSLVGTVEDITEGHRVEEALRESEQRFRSLVSIIADVLWVTDETGAFSSPQSSWEAYTGQSWGEYRGFGWLNALPDEDRDEARQTWKRACESPALFSSRGRLWHSASQRYRYFIVRAIPLFSANGSVREWVGCCTDMDDVVRSAEALKEADRRKNEFLAMLAHELRNPLAPIRNSIEILRRGSGADADRALELMQRQISQMVRLIDDLFDASRVSRGKVELRKGRVEVAELVRHAVEAMRPIYEKMRQELTLDVASEPIYVMADATRLAQVVGNLLNNASKFTPHGGHIRTSVERTRSGESPTSPSASGDVAVIRVRDDGIGIASDQLPRIFDMFTQIDTSLERSQSGLGIGLTLVKDLIEMHGGSVEARSAGLGLGAELIVRLPVADESHAQPEAVDKHPASPVTGQRILVVDDNRDAATSLAALLELTGHEAHVAYDGAEALDKATALRPDVVFLDIGLPQINGYETARLIRQQAWGRDMALVALTGWGDADDLEKSRNAGFDRHLVKPVELEVLTRLLAEFARP